MKTCNRCKKSKELSEFTKNKNTPDGLMRQCRSCNTERSSQHYHSNPDPERRFRRHGVTREWFEEESKKGCRVCLSKKNLRIDHDHAHCAGYYGCAECVRGLLCHGCNSALGLFKDDVVLLQRAISYLSRQLGETSTSPSSSTAERRTVNA